MLQEISEQVIDIALRAGDEILNYYNKTDKSKDVLIKQDRTPLTKADIASHNYICNGLSKIIFEDIKSTLPILSEESDDISNFKRKEWQDYWLVDPLDGTKEFIAQTGEFCINIALIKKHKPIMGVIYAPCKKELYFAVNNMGTYKLDIENHNAHKISINKIESSKPDNFELKIITSSRHHKSTKYTDFFNMLKRKKVNFKVIELGSALKFGYVAEGKADLYPRFGATSEWDTAAGECILKEAGGKLVNIKFDEFSYNKRDILINSDFYAFGDTDFDWKSFLE